MTDYMATIEYTIKKGQKELDRLGAVHRLALKTKATMEQALKEVVIEVPAAPPAPSEPPARGRWGTVGVIVLVVAGIAIATKVLSD